MKIKRVEIIGFKSFVDRVSFDFQEGVTSVVGPNGCGKSNIVDAIRWSMGEQNAKNLRGRSMEDVIFGGSESRKPLGMAEVSMFFDNADGRGPAAFREYAEIMVTRRLYRNGESEYLINKTPCRLLDISELFMDTGVGARAYSIIEQGKIGMILNAKPEDRRFLIEEAAGVTKYKSRKKSALRKIEATRQNLLRLGDIVSEVRRQLNSLKRQAQRAERFRTLREELKGIETRIAAERYRKLQTERDDVCREELGRQQELEGVSGQLAEQELHLEELRLQHVDREKAVTQGQERLFHLGAELQKTEGRLELSQREIETLLRQQERLAAEQEENARRLAGLDGRKPRFGTGPARSAANWRGCSGNWGKAKRTWKSVQQMSRTWSAGWKPPAPPSMRCSTRSPAPARSRTKPVAACRHWKNARPGTGQMPSRCASRPMKRRRCWRRWKRRWRGSASAAPVCSKSGRGCRKRS
jgi:chromosome segregation protein